MKNTEKLYKTVKEYQDKRAKLVSDYEEGLKKLESYKGSAGYTAEVTKRQGEFLSSLSELQRAYRAEFSATILNMRDALGKRTASPPSNEQLNILKLLDMRKSVTEEELDRVAQLVKDNVIAIGLVQETARRNGILKSYLHLTEEMGDDEAQSLLRSLSRNFEDFLLYDTPKMGRASNSYNKERYGTPERELKKRPLINSIEECYSSLAGLSEDGLRRFSQAVDNS